MKTKINRLTYLLIATLIVTLALLCSHIADLTRDNQELTEQLVFVLNVLERVHEEKVERGIELEGLVD